MKNAPAQVREFVRKLRALLNDASPTAVPMALVMAPGHISSLWQMMRKIGGRRPPPKPAWAKTPRDFQESELQLFARGKLKLKYPDAEDVHEALDAVEQWCNSMMSPESTSPQSSDSPKKQLVSRPRSKQVVELCNELARQRANISAGKTTPNEIARKMKPGSKTKAANLLRQAQNYRHLWE